MAAPTRHDQLLSSTRTTVAVAAMLAAGGAAFFVGGGMHPKEDPPGASAQEHLRAMYKDGNWYPGHAVLLIGMVLIAAALLALVRNGALAEHRTLRTAGVMAAVTSALGAGAMLLHLIMATEADKLAAGQSAPLTNANLLVETFVAPAFGLSVAALAVIGASTGRIGNRIAAALAVLGGVAYALASGTVLLTDALNPLFPLSGLLGVWAVVTAVSLWRRGRVAPRSAAPVSG